MRLGYLHLSRFPMQRRVREAPSWAGKPAVLHRDEKGVQRVVFASGAALKAGIRPGQTVAAACALEPSVLRAPYDEAAEAQALLTLGEALLPYAPAFELDAPEGLWLDASAAPLWAARAKRPPPRSNAATTGSEASAGSEASTGRGARREEADAAADAALDALERPWLEAVVQACAALGYQAVAASASQRFTAQALARASSARLTVAPTRAAGALAGLPLSALEVRGALGPGAAGPYRALGLRQLGELASLPAGAVHARFGAQGAAASRLARGDDDGCFTPAALPEVIEEAVALDWPAEALEPILFGLKTVLDRLCARLQGRGRAAVQLAVTLTLDPKGSLQVPLRLARPSSEVRLLVELIRHRLTDLTVTQPICALRVLVEEHHADDGRQLPLGDVPEGDAALEVVLARLASALGKEALFSAQVVDRHRPEEAWVKTPFAPPPAAAALDSLTRDAPEAELSPSLLERPTRLLPAPARLETELSPEGALVAARVQGRRRAVLAIYGPERLSGEWWSPTPYARDYYRVHLEGLGALWVFQDAAQGTFWVQGLFD